MNAAVERLVLARLAPESAGRAWFEKVLDAPDPSAIATAFALAPRKVGGGAIVVTAEERASLASEGLPWIASSATVDELARMALLARAVHRLVAPADPVALTAESYRLGDNGEKRAVLRSLPLLPEPERHVELGALACRSSVQSVFEALSCENPYPAAHFTELAFNQMVLKALFTGVRLERIIELDRRKNAELARMAAGYASERRAAGRSVPDDIDRVLTPES